jgi:hypothetical protein
MRSLPNSGFAPQTQQRSISRTDAGWLAMASEKTVSSHPRDIPGKNCKNSHVGGPTGPPTVAFVGTKQPFVLLVVSYGVFTIPAIGMANHSPVKKPWTSPWRRGGVELPPERRR